MLIELVILVGLYLGFMAVWDIKHRTVPSIFTTSIILILAVVNITNLSYGILSFILAWWLYDFDFIRGVADIKAFIIIGLMVSTLNQFYFFMLFTGIFGFFYSLTIMKVMKVKKGEEIPYLPAIFCIYVALMLLSYL